MNHVVTHRLTCTYVSAESVLHAVYTETRSRGRLARSPEFISLDTRQRQFRILPDVTKGERSADRRIGTRTGPSITECLAMSYNRFVPVGFYLLVVAVVFAPSPTPYDRLTGIIRALAFLGAAWRFSGKGPEDPRSGD